jgi:uncharacterized protein (DUF2141 family)
MNGKISRTRASTAAIAAALLLATPILLLITPALAPASITLSPTRGPVGTSVGISGSGFSTSATVTIYFDKNGNGIFETSEIIATPTAIGGSFSVTVIIPQVTAGYRDYLFFATDGTASASASFTIPPPAITSLDPTRGTAGTSVTVDINYFTRGKDGQIFFDRNNNELPDLGDIIVPFFHSDLNTTGGLTKTLTVPSDIGFGTFKVVAMNNITEKAVRTFTVEQPVIAINPTFGIAGTSISVSVNFYNKTTGAQPTFVFFDTNGNGRFDTGEPRLPASGGLTLNNTGGASGTLTVPSVPPGIYKVYANNSLGQVKFATFEVEAPLVTITPNRGTADTSVTINIAFFEETKAVTIGIDINNNGQIDSGETLAIVTPGSGSGGNATTVRTIPSSIGFGTFVVNATNKPAGGGQVATTTFIVEQPVITISPSAGVPGTSISVSVNFYNKTTGAQPTFVFFDTNGNGRFDTGEPRLPASGGLTLNNTGGASGTLTVPSVPPGIYKVYANNSLGQVKFATFEVEAPLVTITPNRGTADTSVTINIAFFEETKAVTIGIDINNNGQIDSGETLAIVTPGSGSGGNATTVRTIPSSIGFGTFVVNATNKPAGGGQVATTTFIVEQPVITISPSAGVPGTSILVSVNFYNKTTGAQPTFVFFDTNGNGRFDTGEPRLPTTGGLTLNNTGGASGTLPVPSVPPGIYKVYANNSLGQVKFATFEVEAPIMSISPTSGGPGTTVAVFLNFFRKDAPAGDTFVFFDTNGNGIFDPGEPRSPTTGGLTLNNTGGAVTTIQVPFAISTGSYKIFAVNNLQSKFATFDVVSPEEAIENKLDTIVIPKLNQIISLLTDDTFGLNAIKAAVELVKTRVETIGGTLLGAINSVSEKLGTFGPGETVKSLLDAILDAIEDKLDPGGAFYTFVDNWFTTIYNRLGTFSGTDTVASLLYQIKTGDVVASKAETDKTTTSATPYVIGGFPANKAFRGTLTLEINTALGSGVFLAVQVWDGDSWATVWRSATGAPAGTAVSIDIAGLTDGSGNAVRIVTNAATARQFDYVFVYHIDLG